MRKVQCSEARNRFSKLLDEVEGGETVGDTRYGREVARIVPMNEQQIVPVKRRSKAEIARAIEGIKRLAKLRGRVTVEEILAMRDEGRR